MQNYFFQFIFYCTIISIEYLAFTPRHFEIVERSWDKANHVFAFLVLYILFSLSYRRLIVGYKIVFLFLFGLQIEVIQYFLPHRYFSMLDLVADGVGIMVGVIGVWFFKKIINHKYYFRKI